ncbi:hypothetical protein V8C43DRAFT_285530 [Trichoderma afarasin]
MLDSSKTTTTPFLRTESTARRCICRYKLRCLIYLRMATRLEPIVILSESIQIESRDYIDKMPNSNLQFEEETLWCKREMHSIVYVT